MAALRSSLLRHHRLFSATTTTSPFTISISAAKEKLHSGSEPDQGLEMPDTSMASENCAQDITFMRLAKSRKFAEIEKLVDFQKKDPKITLENHFSTLIRSYGAAGMIDHALCLYDQMDELGTPRSSISFNALLSAYNMSRKFDQVPKLFDEIPHKYGFSPDNISYGFFIKSLCESRSPESTFAILDLMEEKNIKVTIVIYTTILDALYRKGKVEKAEKLWNEMRGKGVFPDVAAYNVRIKEAHKGKPEDVLALIEEMKIADLKPNTTSYNFLFACYSENGMIESATKVYQDIEKNGCLPNSATFRLCMTHLCKQGNFGMAYEVFKESMKIDRVPAVRILKDLVKGLVKKSKREEAKSVIRTIKEKFPDNLLDAWNKLELELGLDEDEVSPTQEASAASGKVGLLDVAAYNVRIMHAHKGKPKAVLAVIEDIKNAGLKPDTTSYNYLFACYSKNGMMESATKVYQDLGKNGCLPNSSTFRLCITHLCYKGKFEMAYEVFKDSMKIDKVPVLKILKNLVEGLVKQSKRKKAKSLIRAVKKKFPDKDLDTWNKLELELGLNKDQLSPTQEASAVSALVRLFKR